MVLFCDVPLWGVLLGAAVSWATTQVPANKISEKTVAWDFMILEASIFHLRIANSWSVGVKQRRWNPVDSLCL
jgi:hypothetical protein